MLIAIGLAVSNLFFIFYLIGHPAAFLHPFGINDKSGLTCRREIDPNITYCEYRIACR
ncbi:MAG: hypothetical protein O3B64_02530 [bacterium]|nr:hypothetical protein [bacterium]